MNTLCNAADCTLLIVDPQTRLMPAIHDGENVVRRCVQLATAARELGIHVIGTEENPAGLGSLVDEIGRLCDTVLAKFHFSAVAEEGFMRRLPAGRNTIVIAGCEAHVCALQTALGLLDAGHAVKWVADAVGSRYEVQIYGPAGQLIRTLKRVVTPVPLSSREKRIADSTLSAEKSARM